MRSTIRHCERRANDFLSIEINLADTIHWVYRPKGQMDRGPSSFEAGEIGGLKSRSSGLRSGSCDSVLSFKVARKSECDGEEHMTTTDHSDYAD